MDHVLEQEIGYLKKVNADSPTCLALFDSFLTCNGEHGWVLESICPLLS